MIIRFYKFLIVPMVLFLSQESFGQLGKDSVSSICPKAGRPNNLLNPVLKNEATAFNKFSFLYFDNGAAILPQDHYVKNLAFFCRQEIKFEKAFKIPLRFRVGSLEQCNKLEGK